MAEAKTSPLENMEMLFILYRILYCTWIVIEVLVAIVTRTGSGKGAVRDRGSMLLLWIVIFSSISACEWIRRVYGSNMFGGAAWLRTASVLILFLGLVIRCLAIATLGRAFSANVAIRESQQLNRSGLYHFVRHPSYSGLLLIFLAVGLHSRNWIALLVLMIPATAGLLYRIHIEEAVLRDAFGADYVNYCRQTSRLVPGIF